MNYGDQDDTAIVIKEEMFDEAATLTLADDYQVAGTVEPSLREKTEIPENPYECDICSAPFRQLQKMTSHITKAHRHRDQDTTAYRCADCSSAFHTPAELRQHFLNHFNVARLPPLRRQRRRKRTGRTVSTSKKKRCDVPVRQCGICGKLVKHMWKHKLTHSGVKGHWCTVCGSGFTVSSSLAAHMLLHNGRRPFHCSECGKKFPTKSRRSEEHTSELQSR